VCQTINYINLHATTAGRSAFLLFYIIHEHQKSPRMIQRSYCTAHTLLRQTAVHSIAQAPLGTMVQYREKSSQNRLHDLRISQASSLLEFLTPTATFALPLVLIARNCCKALANTRLSSLLQNELCGTTDTTNVAGLNMAPTLIFLPCFGPETIRRSTTKKPQPFLLANNSNISISMTPAYLQPD
jgi:hypothetical protein